MRNWKKLLVASLACSALFSTSPATVDAAYELNPEVKKPTMALKAASEIGVLKNENPEMIIEPMIVDYQEIQLGAVDKTIAKERTTLNRKYRIKKAAAVERGKASVVEGIKVTACAAAIEGVLSGGISVVKHCQGEKSISELERTDWKEVGLDALTGAEKGAVRGAGIYVLSNYAKLSAPVAGATVNASLSAVDATIKYTKGEITGKVQFTRDYTG